MTCRNVEIDQWDGAWAHAFTEDLAKYRYYDCIVGKGVFRGIWVYCLAYKCRSCK